MASIPRPSLKYSFLANAGDSHFSVGVGDALTNRYGNDSTRKFIVSPNALFKAYVLGPTEIGGPDFRVDKGSFDNNGNPRGESFLYFSLKQRDSNPTFLENARKLREAPILTVTYNGIYFSTNVKSDQTGQISRANIFALIDYPQKNPANGIVTLNIENDGSLSVKQGVFKFAEINTPAQIVASTAQNEIDYNTQQAANQKALEEKIKRDEAATAAAARKKVEDDKKKAAAAAAAAGQNIEDDSIPILPILAIGAGLIYYFTKK